MRKEVKLGMALGSGLIALLVAYLVVAPPSDHGRGAQLALDESGSIIDPAAQAGDLAAATPDDKTTSELTGSQAPAAPKSEQAAPAEASTAERQANPSGPGDQWGVLDNGGKVAKPAKPQPKVSQAAGPNSTAPQSNEASKLAVAKAPEGHETIAVALGGDETYVAPESRPDAQLYYSNPNAALGDGLSTDAPQAVERATKGVVAAPRSATGGSAVKAPAPSSPSALGATAAIPTAGSSHVVRSGETFSSIAQTAYGSAAYYPHLIRANPRVNPNNLKLGTVIALPKMEDVKATGGNARSAAAHLTVADDAPIDPKSQYRVRPGDSLYKISLKVYGKPTHLEAIYERNKQAIGPNPTKLKLGMVLDLPEPATGLASPAQSRTTSALGGGLSGGQH